MAFLRLDFRILRNISRNVDIQRERKLNGSRVVIKLPCS